MGPIGQKDSQGRVGPKDRSFNGCIGQKNLPLQKILALRRFSPGAPGVPIRAAPTYGGRRPQATTPGVKAEPFDRYLRDFFLGQRAKRQNRTYVAQGPVRGSHPGNSWCPL